MSALYGSLTLLQVIMLVLQFAGVINLGIGALLTPLWAILILMFGALFLFVFLVGIASFIANKEDKDD